MRLGRGVAGAAIAVLLTAMTAGVALARNPHCSGGILYVTQAMRDKDKGDMEAYTTEINKAASQLEQCTTEDPSDVESFGYLGWAYAELDSAGPAGKAFATAIQGLTAKGDKKKAEWATGNRNSYWARSFNEGINHIQNAQQAYPDYAKAPADEAETTLKSEAEKHYQQAITSLTRASLLKPGDPQTLRNLGSVYAFMDQFDKAETVFRNGLTQIPGDSSLTQALKAVRTNYARKLVDDKKYEEAIAYFTDLLKTEPNNGDLYLSIGDAYFKRAQGKQADARNADFVLAGDAYAKAGELKPGDADLPFNAALAYQNAGQWAKAEGQWRLASKLRTDDVDALSSLAAVLAEQKKFDESIKTIHAAVGLKPQNKNLHRQFGAIYTKAGNNGKATEELMVYLAMQNGQPVPDAAAAAKGAKGGTAAARTLASDGAPEQVYAWTADQDSYETWFYWAKQRAFTFKAGALVTKSDWSTADTAVQSAGGKK